MAEKITPEFLQKLLVKSESNLKVINVSINPGSGRGDNYTAMLYRLNVNGFIEKDTKEKWDKSIIYKCLPTSDERRQAYRSDALFANEVAFYTQALPALLKFQKSRSLINFTGVPRCYYAKNDILLLEDLRERDFQMLDRKLGLDINQCKAVLKELAKFHALSLGMQELDKENFNKFVVASVHEVMFLPENEEWYKDYYAAACKDALECVREISGEKYASIFEEKFTSGFFKRMTSLVKSSQDENVKVLCHGDCWTNNILFRMDPNSKEILEVCMLDFQLSRIGSPALDLANLLYCCTTQELRNKDLENLLKHYHDEIITTLQKLNIDKEIFKFSDLKLQMKRYAVYGLGLAIDMIPISTCESNDAPDLYSGQTTNETAVGCSLLQAIPNIEGKHRMAKLVEELINQDLL